MGRVSRRGVVLGLGLAAIGLGCGGANPFLALPVLFGDGKSRLPAEFPLKPHDKKKESKVVVFVSSRVGLAPDLAGVDRMLNAELIRVLDLMVKDNEEKVQVLKMPRIDEYKAQNPNWRAAHPCEVGKAVADGTDYVIDVEIQDMDLYKPGSRGQWLQGHATLAVAAYDLSKPLKDPAYKQDFSFEYPQGREIEVESKTMISTFRMAFVQRIASDVARKFSSSSPVRQMD